MSLRARRLSAAATQRSGGAAAAIGWRRWAAAAWWRRGASTRRSCRASRTPTGRRTPSAGMLQECEPQDPQLLDYVPCSAYGVQLSWLRLVPGLTEGFEGLTVDWPVVFGSRLYCADRGPGHRACRVLPPYKGRCSLRAMQSYARDPACRLQTDGSNGCCLLTRSTARS